GPVHRERPTGVGRAAAEAGVRRAQRGSVAVLGVGAAVEGLPECADGRCEVMTNPPPIFAKVDAELVPIEDCTWILNRPCGCACQAFASNSNLASQEAAWRVIYANDKRASRRIEYA